MRLKPSYNPNISDRVLHRRLTQNYDQWPLALGCNDCPDRQVCGGVRNESKVYDCYDHCCGGKEDCQIVCRNNPMFVDQLNEIRGFDLANVPKTLPLPVSLPHGPVPLIFHGSRRSNALNVAAIFLRLRELVDFNKGCVKFTSKEHLCKSMHVSPQTKIYVSGIDKDVHVEKWWRLTRANRPRIISDLKAIGVLIITTPNYSMMLDTPRTDNLHSMKRIAQNYSEFKSMGLSAALHINSRVDRDFSRWKDFIVSRDDISLISYEFTTGTSRAGRKEYHLQKLCEMSDECSRDLDIIVRGNIDVIATLVKKFRTVTYVDTSAFMKTMKRQKAVRVGNDRLAWKNSTTQVGESLDTLLKHNIEEQLAQIRLAYAQNEK